MHITQMSILKIARLGHPILQKIASQVDDYGDPEIKKIISDMTVSYTHLRAHET